MEGKDAGSPKGMGRPGRDLVSCSNQRTSLKIQEEQGTGPETLTDREQDNLQHPVCQSTWWGLLNPALSQPGLIHDMDGILVHGPSYHGPRTLLIVHQELEGTSAR